ncbi:type VI secretion system baseplate subunit TssF [Xenorhabdus sp. 42]|uniref:type VI secretion system baseplate subunit TssF n=1 Tax=Xenorhabdus szentirmaii TaxID=290112 RepID=UPI0019B108CB|nr:MULTISPECIES: type VI secretion system baseplate subunit TssF [unclassified Xenorhabdus]MBD2780851.1 type VI secretion system baseplate subunit TssF [Xenorhabdus sp. 38]MBD2820723.1 type VI secretion system baseplate subunit TssF [Xenorhabdus sp. 42]
MKNGHCCAWASRVYRKLTIEERNDVKTFEHYFQHELAYLRALQRLISQEKPHLADILNGQDPDVEKISEGFAFLTARQHQKIDDGFPEITRPTLQSLRSQAIKGIPATSVMQLHSGIGADSACSVPKGSQMTTEAECIFVTSRQCDIEPLALIRREISYQAKETQLKLTFQYTGKDDHWLINPISLFLSADNTVADSLMLALRQYAYDIRLYRGETLCPMDGIRLEPLQGTSRLILSPPQKSGNWAPQLLLESLYLPHVHHFMTLVLPTFMQDRLSMAETNEFTLTIQLSCELDVSEAQIEQAFHLHCVPVFNRQSLRLTIPFTSDSARYCLPIESGILDVVGVELEQEPDEEQSRGQTCQFYPASVLTGMERGADDELAWFYSLEVSEDALGRLQHELVFRDNRNQLMASPPVHKFVCHLMTFELQAPPLSPGEICYADENIPDDFHIKNLTTVSSPYPPFTNNHHYWTLLSHYSASPFLLYSAEALKHLLLGYDLYADKDRNQSRRLRRLIGGIVTVESVSGDRLVMGVPHRCLFVDLTLDDTAYESEGELFGFANTLFQFLPFCLAQDMRMLMKCHTTSGETYVLSRYPVQGYRPLM